jgi:hypothetical protein
MSEVTGPGPDDARPRPPRVRANALDAAAFVRVSEVDPRVVEALLDALEDAGVAAYAQPQPDGSSYTEHVRPRRGRNRLEEEIWVDRDRRDVASTVLEAELPGLLAELRTPERTDAAFDAIVAGWDDAAVPAVPPWPVHEDLDVTTRDPDDPALRRSSPPPLTDDDDAADDYDDDPDDHFVPPPPAPVPPPSQATKYALAGLALGFAFLLGAQRLLGFPSSSSMRYLGVVMILVAVAALVSRMRDAPPIDDGPDDGAVV